MVKHDCSSAVYVGDTNGDCQAAFSAGIPLVYAAYGFGKISEPSLVAAEADDFEKYRKILR